MIAIDVFIVLGLYTYFGFWHALVYYMAYCLFRRLFRHLLIGK